MKFCVFILIIILSTSVLSQEVDFKPTKDTLSHWEKKNTVGFDLSEIAFLNWNAGGVNSISGLLKGNFIRRYSKNNIKWGNELIVRYGVNKQEEVEWRKTDDAFQFNSNLGYRKDSLSNWYHSLRFSFSTQFTNGYAYPNTNSPISKPFAPAYSFFGGGAEYSNKEKKINIYLSPLTVKNTLVLDRRLANQGAFGVEKAEYDPITGTLIKKGKRSRTELGCLVTGHHKHLIFKNMTLENKLSLYSDYINNFGNVDVDWQMSLDMVVNEYVKANIGTHLIYDDDIKAKEERGGEQVVVGPKVQLKQILGVGLSYTF